MNKKFKDLIKYDRIVFTLSILLVMDLAVFLYFLGRTHEMNCEYFALQSAGQSLFVLFLLALALSVYAYLKTALTGKPKATNMKLWSHALGIGGIVLGFGLLYVVVAFGLFFGKYCYA